MATLRKAWPPAANGARLKSMENSEEVAGLARRGLKLASVQADPQLQAILAQIWALAEETRRQLGEARASE